MRAPSLHAHEKPEFFARRSTRAFFRDRHQEFKSAGVSSVEPSSTTITSYGSFSGLTDLSTANKQAFVKIDRFRTGITIEQHGPSPGIDWSTLTAGVRCCNDCGRSP